MRLVKYGSFFGTVLVCSGLFGSQNRGQWPGQDMQVELTTPIKATKARVGDRVTALTVAPVKLANGITVPANSKVVGHVRKVEADSGGEHSSIIALSFEEIQLKKGQAVPLNCFVRAALLPRLKGVMAQDWERSQSAPPIVTSPRDMGDTADTYLGSVNNGYSQTGVKPSDASDVVSAHRGEVVGMPGVELQIADPDHVSTFKSTHKNLELSEGLEFMLWVIRQ